ATVAVRGRGLVGDRIAEFLRPYGAPSHADQTLHRMSSGLRMPGDRPGLERLRAAGAVECRTLGAKGIAERTLLPPHRGPFIADRAEHFVGAGLRRPVDRRFRLAGRLHGTEMVEAALAVRSGRFIGDGIAERLPANGAPARADQALHGMRAEVGMPRHGAALERLRAADAVGRRSFGRDRVAE